MDKGDRERRRERVRRFIKEGMEQGDSSVVDELWGEMETSRKWGADFESTEEFKGWVEENPERYADLTFDIQRILVDGDDAAVRCRASGVATGEQYGIVPDGQSFDIQLSMQVEFDEDGLLASIRTDFDFLEMLPESSRYARVSFVETAEDAVVVVDDEARVTEINQAAVAAFAPAESKSALLGESLMRLLPTNATLPGYGETSEIEGTDGQLYEATASPIENTWEESIGQVYVFRDVTERRRRVQQLQVLSRVLRHNIRNDLNVVLGRIDAASAATERPAVAEELRDARGQAESLLATAETAREVQGVIGQTTRRRRDLVTAVESAVDQFHGSHPDVPVDVSVPDRLPVEVTDPLADALYELIENAWEHGKTEPIVRVETDDDEAVVSIHDDGPGFPDRELVVIEEGEETQLKHGSGLGLWFVRWVVTASDGELAVTSGADGSVVTLRFPLADDAGGGQPASDSAGLSPDGSGDRQPDAPSESEDGGHSGDE